MKLFDSHCHINDKCFKEDYDEVLNSAYDADVRAMMIVGVDVESSGRAVELAEKHDELFASVGVHPHDSKSCSMEKLDILKKMTKNSKVKAWGETGLDFNRMHSPADDQEKWLERQLDAAEELDLPVIFHERESNGRLVEILKSRQKGNLRGVIHCFSGTKKELHSYLDLGYYIGITGIVTIQKRGAFLREIVPLIPENRILIETDAPYLTPAPKKNKTRRNEPGFVRFVFLKLAEITGNNPAMFADQIWENTCNLFNVPFTKGEIGK